MKITLLWLILSVAPLALAQESRTAICRDGTKSTVSDKSKACKGHRGVVSWVRPLEKNKDLPISDTLAQGGSLDIQNQAESHFKLGLEKYFERRGEESRIQFDLAVGAFLESGINLSLPENIKVKACYEGLIETIFRIEFPNDGSIDLESLASTCGWKLNSEIAQITSGKTLIAKSQVFQGDPLDQLAQTPEEKASEAYVKTSVGQKPTDYICSLKNTDVPTIRGLKLGMTKSQVNKVYPALQNRQIDWHTYKPVLVRPNKQIQELYISMANDKIISFKIVYIREVDWKSVTEFAEAFSRSLPLKIDLGAWKLSPYVLPEGGGMTLLFCKDFSITASLDRYHYEIKVEDRQFWDQVLKEDELKKKRFKP